MTEREIIRADNGETLGKVNPLDRAIRVPFSTLDLMAKLMEHNATETAAMTNRVIESLTQQLAEANATIDLIREDIGELVSGPYMPNPSAYIDALWPSKDRVEQYIDRSEVNTQH